MELEKRLHYSVVVVDDHAMFASAIADLVSGYRKYKVLYTVRNGKELMEKMRSPENVPDIILLDINMPVMNGYQTVEWLEREHRDVLVLALSVDNDEQTIVRMIRAGARGYVLKDASVGELLGCMNSMVETGYAYSEMVRASLLASALHPAPDPAHIIKSLSERDLEFIRHSCSELTYREIADAMNISPRTVETVRENLFMKLKVSSRVGIVLFAVKHKLIHIGDLK